MKVSLVLVSISFAVLLTVVAVRQAQAANPAAFSVNGIRLYMTPSQALGVLKARSVPDVQVIKTGCSGDVAAAIAHSKDPRRITISPHCIGAIRSKTTQVKFIEDYPAHPGSMRVYSVEYIGASGDADIFKALLRGRYGPPTWSWDDKESWCAAQPGPIKEMYSPVFSDPCGVNEMPINIGPDLNGTISDLGTLSAKYPAIALEVSVDSLLRVELHDKRFAYTRNGALLHAQDAAIKRATRLPF